MARGFYSLVQYCPDRFRAETVNVGLVVLSLEPHAVRVRMARNFKRLRRCFSIGHPAKEDLSLMFDGMASRIESGADGFRSSDDLAAFASTRANDLRLTEPRLMKIEDLEKDFEELYKALVEMPTEETKQKKLKKLRLPAELEAVFSRLNRAGKVWEPGLVTVPVFRTELEIPYAFRNGVVNYVKPHRFRGTAKAEAEAAQLALNGDLIRKNKVDGQPAKLIVVSTQETEQQQAEIDEHIAPLFEEYQVRLVRPCETADYARELEETAH